MLTRFALGLSLAASLAAGAVATAQPVRPLEEGFVLLGVVVVDGEGGLAWLQEPRLTENRPVTVRKGEALGPYRLVEILDDRVVLEGPSGAVSVPMLTSGTGGSTAVAAGPAGPAPGERPAVRARDLGGPGHAPPASRAAAAGPPAGVPRNPLALTAEALQQRARAEAARAARALQTANPPAGGQAPAGAAGAAPAAQPAGSEPPAAGQPPAGTPAMLTADEILRGGTPTFQNPNVRYFPIGDPRRNQSFAGPR